MRGSSHDPQQDLQHSDCLGHGFSTVLGINVRYVLYLCAVVRLRCLESGLKRRKREEEDGGGVK